MSAPRRLAVVVALTAVALGAVAVGGCTPDGPGSSGDAVEANAVVERVVDGDTVSVEVAGTDESVRLIGIDTPESVARSSPVECFGKEAAARLRALLPPGTPVRLTLDAEPRDRFGRLLAHVHRAADGTFVNVTLAAEGYAGELRIPPNLGHADEVRAAVADARRSGRGLWSACAADLPVG